MNKEIAKELNIYANEVCSRYSKKDRAGNYNKETFSISEVIPTSDHTASVIFKKNTGKLAAFFFTILIGVHLKDGSILYQQIHI